MRIRRVIIENFLSIGEMEVDFENYTGLTLIEGVNSDSPTANSNGAGKSSLYEAIFWCLFGKTKRGLNGDDVINRSVGKDCAVTLQFDDVIVTRARKHSLYPSGLHLTVGPDDRTQGTIKDTQAILDSLVGMGELTFSKVANFGQGDIKDFAALTDSELKEVFEQSLGLGFFADSLKRTKERRGELNAKVASVQSQIETLAREIDFTFDKIATLKRADKDVEEAAQRMIAQYEQDVTEAETQKKQKETELAQKRVALEKASALITKASGAMQKFQEELGEVRKAFDAAKMNVALWNERVSQLSTALDKKVAALKSVPKDCDKCLRPLDESSVKAHVESAAEETRVALEAREAAKASLTLALNEQEAQKSKLEALAKEGEKYASIEKHAAELAVERRHLAMLETEIENYANRIINVQAQIASIKGQKRGNGEEIEQLTKKASTDTAARKGLERELKELEETLETTMMLEEILGNGGLKSYVLDNITPELNRIVSEYMNVLNPAIAIEISTISKLKSGEYRDKFSIKVTTEDGAGDYKGNSGGERQFVNFAISLGFNSLCRAMSSGSLNILFLDEPFESLDDAAAENAVELCKRFASNIEHPFIITHNPAIRDIVSSRMKVVKKGGKTTLGK